MGGRLYLCKLIMSEADLFEKLSAWLDFSDEKLTAISERLERIETILDGKDKKDGLIARVGHQIWLTVLTTLLVALFFFAL